MKHNQRNHKNRRWDLEKLRPLTLPFLISVLAGLSTGWGHVGNAGDPLRLMFTSAREHAAFVTNRIHPDAFPPDVAPDLKKWILENKERLAGDILASSHNWVEQQEPTCAHTLREPGAAINLSFPTCRVSVQVREDASRLLVHESVHHFDVDDEAFADAVADAIYDAWASGILDWQPTPSTQGVIESRSQHAATWDGSYMYVFGGLTQQTTISNSLVRFDPGNNRWTALPSLGAEPRYKHELVLAGDKLIAWGGFTDIGSGVYQASGQIFDLKNNVWRTIGGTRPAGRSGYVRTSQTASWAGSRLVVWGSVVPGTGGGASNSSWTPEGGLYDPATDTWSRVELRGAPIRYAGHSAVSTGSEVLVWGGKVPPGVQGNNGVLSNEGAIYHPATNSWRAMSTRNAPSPRMDHVAVWTGSKMIVFGGSDNTRNIKGSGGIYDPATDTWSSFTSEVASQRVGHTAVWTGDEMLIWGGRTSDSYFSAVVAFNPRTSIWRSLAVASNPTPRDQHTAVWTGMSMIVWGGGAEDRRTRLDSGGLFYP